MNVEISILIQDESEEIDKDMALSVIESMEEEIINTFVSAHGVRVELAFKQGEDLR